MLFNSCWWTAIKNKTQGHFSHWVKFSEISLVLAMTSLTLLPGTVRDSACLLPGWDLWVLTSALGMLHTSLPALLEWVREKNSPLGEKSNSDRTSELQMGTGSRGLPLPMVCLSRHILTNTDGLRFFPLSHSTHKVCWLLGLIKILVSHNCNDLCTHLCPPRTSELLEVGKDCVLVLLRNQPKTHCIARRNHSE